MKLIQVRIWITIFATLVAIGFAIAVDQYPENAGLLLTIEVILLPAIYIAGNYLAENMIQEKFEEQLGIIDKESRAMKDKVIELTYENQLLKNGGNSNGGQKS